MGLEAQINQCHSQEAPRASKSMPEIAVLKFCVMGFIFIIVLFMGSIFAGNLQIFQK